MINVKGKMMKKKRRKGREKEKKGKGGKRNMGGPGGEAPREKLHFYGVLSIINLRFLLFSSSSVSS